MSDDDHPAWCHRPLHEASGTDECQSRHLDLAEAGRAWLVRYGDRVGVKLMVDDAHVWTADDLTLARRSIDGMAEVLRDEARWRSVLGGVA